MATSGQRGSAWGSVARRRTTHGRAARIGVVVVVLALALTACTVQTSGSGTRAAGPSATASPSPSPSDTSIPTIGFNDCTKLVSPDAAGIPASRAKSLTFSCGTAALPVDYANPAAGTVSVYVLKVHDDAASDPKPLIVNPGGPGGSGVSLAVSLAGAVTDDILQAYDLIGIDPRGVGLSSPLTCLTNEQKDQVFAADPDVRTPAGLQQANDIAAEWVAGCSAKAGNALGAYNTVYAATDMDRIRQSLGATSMDYLGYSYGTLLGATYAHLFPTTVGRMVLDGAIDPGQPFQSSSEIQAAGFEAAFGQFAADCVTRSSCATMGDPTTAVEQLAAKAAANGGIPVSGSNSDDARKATDGIIYSGVAGALYDESEWPALGDAIVDAQNGDGKGLLQLSDEYYQRSSSGDYTNLIDAFTAFTCNDEGTTYSNDQLTAFGNDWAAKYPVFGAYFAGQMAMCNGWPASGHPVPTVVTATGSKPIVVVGTIHDPATPYANTAALATSLGVGVVVSWNGQGHTAYLKSDCVDKTVDAYLLQGTVPTADPNCPAK